MNKYEKAFEVLKEHATFDTVDELIDLKELVEKATPKALNEKSSLKQCPKCKRTISSYGCIKPNIKYCPRCGQALKWGE